MSIFYQWPQENYLLRRIYPKLKKCTFQTANNTCTKCMSYFHDASKKKAITQHFIAVMFVFYVTHLISVFFCQSLQWNFSNLIFALVPELPNNMNLSASVYLHIQLSIVQYSCKFQFYHNDECMINLIKSIIGISSKFI